MNQLAGSSLYFGMLVSVGAYLFGLWLRKKTGLAILNPLLVAIILIIAFLSAFHINYEEYNRGAGFLSYFLTPATVCLAITGSWNFLRRIWWRWERRFWQA